MSERPGILWTPFFFTHQSALFALYWRNVGMKVWQSCNLEDFDNWENCPSTNIGAPVKPQHPPATSPQQMIYVVLTKFLIEYKHIETLAALTHPEWAKLAQ